MRNQDKFRGCLIGGAAGDALGYAVEFMREDEIFRKYGGNGITEYDLRNGTALISDDTQMTLFTAAGLLAGATRGRMRGMTGSYTGHIHHAYTDWLETQMEQYPRPNVAIPVTAIWGGGDLTKVEADDGFASLADAVEQVHQFLVLQAAGHWCARVGT